MPISRKIGFDKIGSPCCEKLLPEVIYRLPRNPPASPGFQYIVVTDRPEMALSADLLSADNFNNIKGILKKRNKTGLGLEFLVSKARIRQSSELAKWFTDLREAQRFCESSGCQFILSSGAQNPSEMVSARCLEAIINEIGIDTKRYWQDLCRWLDDVLARKVILA